MVSANKNKIKKQGIPLTPKFIRACNQHWSLEDKVFNAEQIILRELRWARRPGIVYFGSEGEVLRKLVSNFLPSFSIVQSKDFRDCNNLDLVFLPHLTDSKENAESICQTGFSFEKNKRFFVYPLLFWSFLDCKNYLGFLDNPKIVHLKQIKDEEGKCDKKK